MAFLHPTIKQQFGARLICRFFFNSVMNPQTKRINKENLIYYEIKINKKFGRQL